MKKPFYLLLFLFFCCSASAQNNTVSIYDFVKIKNNHTNEALYYYENNWKYYRDIALAKNYISSYKIVRTVADSVANFDMILITEYADSLSYQLGEERFSQIIQEVRPNGPLLLSDLKPNDFRQLMFFRRGETIVQSAKQ